LSSWWPRSGRRTCFCVTSFRTGVAKQVLRSSSLRSESHQD